MSSRLDLKNEKIAKYLLEIKEIIYKNSRFLIYSTLLFFLIGLVYSFTITPKFSLSANDIISLPPDLLEETLNMSVK